VKVEWYEAKSEPRPIIDQLARTYALEKLGRVIIETIQPGMCGIIEIREEVSDQGNALRHIRECLFHELE